MLPWLPGRTNTWPCGRTGGRLLAHHLRRRVTGGGHDAIAAFLIAEHTNQCARADVGMVGDTATYYVSYEASTSTDAYGRTSWWARARRRVANSHRP